MYEMINIENFKAALGSFSNNVPFDHCVIDDFFDLEVADNLADEFPAYDCQEWFVYKNALENKKALNDWNLFPKNTYKVFNELYSPSMLTILRDLVGERLYPDHGLHGGGWHIHSMGGNLNPHIDYALHPKTGLARKLNIIVYLSRKIREEHGGHLGFWEHDPDTAQPGNLKLEIQPKFNRAVLFDTTQNSWHGISRKLTLPSGVFRKSLAVYFMSDPSADTPRRGRALYAPREEQKTNKAIWQLIEDRSDIKKSVDVYRTE